MRSLSWSSSRICPPSARWTSLASEHTFCPAIADVEAIADALQLIVKTLNNFLFATVIDRTVLAGSNGKINWKWAWNYPAERKRFLMYYGFFAAQKSAEVSSSAKDVYDSFRARHAPMIVKIAKKPLKAPSKE